MIRAAFDALMQGLAVFSAALGLFIPAALAASDPCTFAPFTLNNGIPMPGMHDGRLIFESAEICATLPDRLKGAVSRDGFLDLQVQGKPVDDVVPLGGGLLAPSRRMGCRPGRRLSTRILFEDGELLLSEADEGLGPTHAIHMLISVWRNWIGVPELPEACRAEYEAALLHAVFPRPKAHDAVDLINLAATHPDACDGTDFREPLRGIAARWGLTWTRSGFLWARVGECLLSGLVLKPSEYALDLSCPGHSGEIIVVVPPSLVPAFIGANSGMTADAVIHPMDETCLGAWEIWETRPLEPRTPYRAEDQ